MAATAGIGPRRRAATIASVAGVMVAAMAGPAFAHASFPGATNPNGTAASPYPGGTVQTIKMNVPFEQDGVIVNGAENTVTDVRVTAPTGWKSAACGDVRTTGYGSVVGGWTCTVANEGGRETLHWVGAQVAAGKTADDSGQYFTFLITTPTPSAVTTYGGSGGSANGFRVVQKYADGATSVWKTPNDTTTGELANGLVRTVAAASGATGGATGGATALPATPPKSAPPVVALPPAKPIELPKAKRVPAQPPAGQTVTADLKSTKKAGQNAKKKAEEKKKAAAADDPLPHTGTADPRLLVATSAVLALGLITVASTTRPLRVHARRPGRYPSKKR